MNLVLLQTDIRGNRQADNRKNLLSRILAHKGADLYVLPEMFATGFNSQAAQVADSHDVNLNWMKRTAVAAGGAVVGSVAVKENGHYYNRCYFVTPEGEISCYDKRHLFGYAGEDREYTAGTDRVIVSYRGWRFLLQTCYDLRFPCSSRNYNTETGLAAYDVALYVASWPSPRIEAWDILLRARAIENQCFVIGVNRVGSDTAANYNGHSGVVDYRGHLVAHAEEWCEDVVTHTLDKITLLDFRERFPTLTLSATD